MGMFDYMECEMPLPSDPAPPVNVVFQTKDVPTDQLWMETWVISTEGRLIKKGVRYEDRSDPNAEPGTIDSIIGCMTSVEVPENDKQIFYHGDIEFHHCDNSRWWSYIARFSEGVCTKIWCAECRELQSQ